MHLGLNMFLITAIKLLVVIQTTKSAAQTVNSGACNSCCTPGIPGVPGHNGNSGASGPQGVNGVKGEQGIHGEQGMKGAQGMKGEIGKQGLQGLKGEKGDGGSIGLRGIPGKMGPTGPQGIIGLPGVNNIKGEKGEQASRQKSAFTAVFKFNPGRVTGLLMYDTIITNVGNDYNNETGKFVCTIPGVYVFQVTSRKDGSNRPIATKVMKNDIVQVSTRTSNESLYSSASTMVVLDLVSGDEVWTEPIGTTYNYYSSDPDGFCSFSGFLLYAA